MATCVQIFVILVVWLQYIQAKPGGTGLRCHQCTGVTDPHYCSMVVQCDAGEECHTEKVIGEDSTVFYNSGCQNEQLCKLAANGKRSQLHVCEGCCNTDLCNSELCPVNNSSAPGVQCYQCDEVDRPQDCKNRITCADGEQCIVTKYANDNMEVKYSLGCETVQRCNLLESLSRRSTQICNKCCDTPGCNRHLCENGKFSPELLKHSYGDSTFQYKSLNSTVGVKVPSSSADRRFLHSSTPIKGSTTIDDTCRDEPDLDCKLANDTHDICALRTIAATKYCQKFCGYCSADGSTIAPFTGTTVETCMDSGDIDCKQMNDSLQLCANKNSPPAILYCPKFCRICTPSTGSSVTTLPPTTSVTEDYCKDDGKIDCQQMNATLGICGQTSGPTVQYCSKTCGLCTPDCADSPDVDCKLANDTHNDCALGSLTAVKYCRKFCGYCSVYGSTVMTPPSGTATTCADSGDIDCKEMDDSLGICQQNDSPPTVMYCPKYCGLC